MIGRPRSILRRITPLCLVAGGIARPARHWREWVFAVGAGANFDDPRYAPSRRSSGSMKIATLIAGAMEKHIWNPPVVKTLPQRKRKTPRLKIEGNTRAHFTAPGRQSRPMAATSPWFTAKARISNRQMKSVSLKPQEIHPKKNYTIVGNAPGQIAVTKHLFCHRPLHQCPKPGKIATPIFRFSFSRIA